MISSSLISSSFLTLISSFSIFSFLTFSLSPFLTTLSLLISFILLISNCSISNPLLFLNFSIFSLIISYAFFLPSPKERLFDFLPDDFLWVSLSVFLPDDSLFLSVFLSRFFSGESPRFLFDPPSFKNPVYFCYY